MTNQLIYCIPKFSEAQRIITFLDGLSPIGDLLDAIPYRDDIRAG